MLFHQHLMLPKTGTIPKQILYPMKSVKNFSTSRRGTLVRNKLVCYNLVGKGLWRGMHLQNGLDENWEKAQMRIPCRDYTSTTHHIISEQEKSHSISWKNYTHRGFNSLLSIQLKRELHFCPQFPHIFQNHYNDFELMLYWLFFFINIILAVHLQYVCFNRAACFAAPCVLL